MSQALPATLNVPEIRPPSPLKVDSEASPALDAVLAKKRSRGLFKSASIRRKRKDSTTKSTLDPSTAEDGVRRRPLSSNADGLGDHLRAVDPLAARNEAGTIDLTEPITVQAVHELSTKQTVDIYRWAVLYENQRGVTLLSMSRYGSRSLLPSDPAPFTIPTPSLSHLTPEEARTAMLTPATLRDFQLPDAKWKWVSKYWLVDMRGDGQVDASGFEYNWGFRSKGWRAYPGTLSAGGWVRRRRWVRLMMRPADGTIEAVAFTSDSPTGGLTRSASRATLSVAPRSSMVLDSDRSYTDLSFGGESALGNTWRGEPEADWERCRRLMRHFGHDGRKLELWCDWLGVSHDPQDAETPKQDYTRAKGKEPSRQDSAPSPLDIVDPMCLSTEDFSTPNPVVMPEREYVLPVLRKHGEEILAMFIFPDSRAQFLNILDRAGIGRDAVVVGGNEPTLAMSTSPSMPEFWSRRSRITEANIEDEADAQPDVASYQINSPEKPSLGRKDGAAVKR